MARWNHAERTIDVKLVYYGPTLGGKSATLAALASLAGEAVGGELISVRSPDERTLLFDLLPLEAGAILGHRVSIKAYATPGQVPLDAPRRVVLAGADAVVFVADSRPSRREQNVWSLQNLRLNMRCVGLESARVPLVVQFNKQDLADAASAEAVASWLGVDPGRGFESDALAGRGVLEPFVAACRAMLERIFDDPPAPARRPGDRGALARDVDAALAPYMTSAKPGQIVRGHRQVVPAGEDLLGCALEASMQLAESLAVSATSEGGAVAAGARRATR
jgi:signal recognition particle receptor subunit beta